MSVALRFALGLALLAIFIWIALLNWRVFYLRLTGRRAPSWIPLMGGVSGAAGLLLLPVGEVAGYWWVPPLLDYGCVPGLIHTLYWWARR